MATTELRDVSLSVGDGADPEGGAAQAAAVAAVAVGPATPAESTVAHDETHTASTATVVDGARLLDDGDTLGGGEQRTLRGRVVHTAGDIWRTPRKRFAAIGVCVGLAIVIIIIAAVAGGDDDGVPVGTAECPTTDMSRLPTALSPQHYQIRLHPLFDAPRTFSGSMSVEVQVLESTRCVIMHADGLNVSSVSIEGAYRKTRSSSGSDSDSASDGESSAGGSSGDSDSSDSDSDGGSGGPLGPQVIADVDIGFNDDNKMMSMALTGAELRQGTIVTISMSFSGDLDSGSLSGLYMSHYEEEDGTPASMVTTQFEATFARRAFPCFDEPAMKATFGLTAEGVPDGMVALSNMPVDNAASDPANGVVAFETTVRMSTYLVALVIGRLSEVEVFSPSGVLVRVWARAEFADETQFALDTAAAIVSHYEDFFGVPFPLPKCDLVAVPDFAAGAMENWGLITFRETTLLYSESLSSAFDKQVVAVDVSHELAHQWFGNLVTMEWWQSLWLNEGFATYTEFNGVEFTNPEMSIYSHFLSDNPQAAMSVDDFAQSHALNNDNVHTAQQIEAMFDGISYSKGASIIRMVASFMNSRVDGSFEEGIRAYLEAHKFGNAKPTQLWAALSSVLPEGTLPHSLDTLLYNYTASAGVPLVTFAWDPQDATKLTVSQERFYRSEYSRTLASQLGRVDAAPLWWVPVSLAAQKPGATGVTTAAQQLVDGFSTQTWDGRVTYNADNDGWMKANIGQTVYARVNYPEQVWSALGAGITAQLRNLAPEGDTILSADDRSGVVDDAFSLAGALQIPMPLALEVGQFLMYETEYPVWITGAGHMDWLLHRFHPDDAGSLPGSCAANFDAYVRELVEPLMANLGYDDRDGDTVLEMSLRATGFSLASKVGIAAANTQAGDMFTAWQADESSLSLNLQSVVFQAAVRHGGEDAYNAVQQAYLNTEHPSTKRRLLLSLAAATEPALIERTLEFALSENVRSQDTVHLVVRVARTNLGRLAAWRYVVENWHEFDTRYGAGGFALSSLVYGVSNGFDSPAMLEEVTSFWASNPAPAAETERGQAIESIQQHMALLEDEHTGLQAACSWLAAQ